MRRWLGPGLLMAPQRGADLGRRMKRAFDQAFGAGCREVVLVGTDCPSMTADDLADAFSALAGHDLVLGPSLDGGYWLVGLRAPAELFGNVPWGTDAVLARTLELAEREGLSVRQLRFLADVDRPEDLQGLAPDQSAGVLRPVLSVIIPALNEASHIASAVGSARCDGAEVLVVDGGSSDDTARLAARAGARVLQCAPGRAAQMNFGARAAGATALLFLHADTVLPAGYAARVFDALSDPGVVGGSFGFLTTLGAQAMGLITRVANFRSRYLRLPYGDQGLFVRRRAFEALGDFPDLPMAEDLVFVRRLRKLGRIAVLAEPAVTSARRWRQEGVWKTTAVNNVVLAACCLGVSPRRLARVLGRGPHVGCEGPRQR